MNLLFKGFGHGSTLFPSQIGHEDTLEGMLGETDNTEGTVERTPLSTVYNTPDFTGQKSLRWPDIAYNKNTDFVFFEFAVICRF